MGLTVNGREKAKGRRARPRETPVEPTIAAVNAILPICTIPHYQSGVLACGTAMSDQRRRGQTVQALAKPRGPWSCSGEEDCLALPVIFAAGLVNRESEDFE